MKTLLIAILLSSSFGCLAGNIGDESCNQLIPPTFSKNSSTSLDIIAKHTMAVQWVKGFREGSYLGHSFTESELNQFARATAKVCTGDMSIRTAALALILEL